MMPMMHEDLLPAITQIIADQALLDPAQIDPDADLDGLGLDSLAMVESLYNIEERFDIHVPFNANADTKARPEFRTARMLAQEVARLIADRAE